MADEQASNNYRILIELVSYLLWQPAVAICRQVLHGLLLIVTAWKAGLIRWRIRSLWRDNPKGSARWFRCEKCGRLCHVEASCPMYWVERREGKVVLVGKCQQCKGGPDG